MEPQVTTPVPKEAWLKLLDADTEALPTQTPAWLACICETYRFEDASRLYRWDDGGELIVPMARRRAVPTVLATEAGWPFDWGIGGTLAPGGAVTTEQAAAVFDDLGRRPVLRTYLRPNLSSAAVWLSAAPRRAVQVRHTTQTVDLRGGFGHIWSERFRGSVRRAIRKAERSRLQVEHDSTGRLVPLFYELFERSVARWAEQQHEPLALARWRAWRRDPRRKFDAVARQLGDACTVWVAWADGEPAASIIVLRHGGQAKYWRGAMNKDLAGETRANDLLHRLAIEDACSAGCLAYHMGESRPSSSLARFKSGFGAEMYESHGYWMERLPISAADSRLRGVAKRVIGFRDG